MRNKIYLDSPADLISQLFSGHRDLCNLTIMNVKSFIVPAVCIYTRIQASSCTMHSQFIFSTANMTSVPCCGSVLCPTLPQRTNTAC